MTVGSLFTCFSEHLSSPFSVFKKLGSCLSIFKLRMVGKLLKLWVPIYFTFLEVILRFNSKFGFLSSSFWIWFLMWVTGFLERVYTKICQGCQACCPVFFIFNCTYRYRWKFSEFVCLVLVKQKLYYKCTMHSYLNLLYAGISLFNNNFKLVGRLPPFDAIYQNLYNVLVFNFLALYSFKL